MPLPTEADATAVSFAHLSGIALPASGARAESEDKDKDREDENPDEDAEEEDDKKSKKAKAKSKAKADDEDDGSDADMEESDEDEDDGKDKRDAKSARSAERARWAAVLGNKAFARAPAMGAKLLATTNLSAKAITGLLAEAPAAATSSPASSARSERNPQLGGGAPNRGAAAESHMVASMQKAREAASRTGNRR
jgi:hypothetical protein